jgi:hypothetical protein
VKRGNFWFGGGLALLCLSLVIFAVSCGGGGGDSGGSGSTGTLNLSLTDASTTDYQAIYVSINQVEVHKDGGAGWEVVSTPNKTYNLLELVNGIRAQLALTSLPIGHYTQMRLILSNDPSANYVIDSSGNAHELKVPSGFQTGIKIVKGFDINTNETTELILDFDATRSVVEAGSGGQWLLKPTIKLLKEYSIIQGSAGQEGVSVSAQVYNSAATASEDEVEVKANTVTDASGNYKLFLEPGTYTLVAYKDGYGPSYKEDKIVTVAATVYTKNFTLVPSDMGTLNGNISISGSGPEQYATISIRQDATVGGNTEQIEVKSLNVVDEGDFSVPLPAGSYTAVFSSYGKTTQVGTFTISAGSPTDLVSIILG